MCRARGGDCGAGEVGTRKNRPEEPDKKSDFEPGHKSHFGAASRPEEPEKFPDFELGHKSHLGAANRPEEPGKFDPGGRHRVARGTRLGCA